MEVTLAAIADYASVSQDGKMNIMGIFQFVNPAHLPWILPTLYIVVSFQASQAEIGSMKTIRIALIDSEGREQFRLEQTVAVPPSPFPRTRPRFNHLIGLNAVKLDAAGDYAFSILINEEEKASLPLRVNPPPEPPETV